jgi:hypothetical protein
VLGDSHEPRCDLLGGQLDGVWMSRQLRSVHRLVHRGAALEPFERLPFRYLREPNR